MSKSKHEKEEKQGKLPKEVFAKEHEAPKEEKKFETEERYVFEPEPKEEEVVVNPLVVTPATKAGSSPNSHETWPFIFRKRIGLSLSGALVNDLLVIWKPRPGRIFKITQVYTRQGTVTGTVSAASAFSLQNNDATAGADAPDAVAVAFTNSIDLTTKNAFKIVPLAGDAYIDNTHPLTLKVTTAQTGAGVHTFELILVAVKLSR